MADVFELLQKLTVSAVNLSYLTCDLLLPGAIDGESQSLDPGGMIY